MNDTFNSKGRYCAYLGHYYIIDRYKIDTIVLRRVDGLPNRIEVPNKLSNRIRILLLRKNQKRLLNNRIFFDDFINDLCYGRTKEQILELYNDVDKIHPDLVRESNDYTVELIKEIQDKRYPLLRELTKIRLYTRITILKRSKCTCGSSDIIWYGDRLNGILYDNKYFVICKSCSNLLEITRKENGFQRYRNS